MEIIIISGNSGAGKSIALSALEDLGYYCIDNIIPSLINLVLENLTSHKKLIISIDIRNSLFDPNSNIVDTIKNLKKKYKTTVVYLSCDPSTLIRRYANTRRKHPLMINNSITLEKAIELENIQLQEIKDYCDIIINTANISNHQLIKEIKFLFKQKNHSNINLILESFGFKYGLPLASDFVLDARFLPNPYWNNDIKHFNGTEQPIINFFQEHPIVQDYINDITKFIDKWLPKITDTNRSLLTISIGCTGGKHRSVYIVEQLNKIYKDKFETIVYHRTLQK